MVDVRADILFLWSFLLEKKSRFFLVIISFIAALYFLVGILTISTTRTLSYVLDTDGWIRYIFKLPLQLEHRMNTLGIIFFLATLALASVYMTLVLSSFTERTKHVRLGSAIGVLTLLGLGCASCGALILTSLLSFFGAAGILTILPLHGGEFQILAFVLVLVSLHIFVKKMREDTCQI